ncbi:MAG: RHS repeat-associated core domain-containing protein [Bacteroidetes bacterium]|nr:RHS repeat-associated core domain-containing protein [Bacteroidota bacterium]
MLPENMRQDSKFSVLRAQMDMALPDKGGLVAVLYQEPGGDSLEVDRLGYGEYFGLAAENDEVVDSLIDSLEVRGSLTSVLRRGFSLDPVVVGGGPVYHGGGVVGQSDPAVEPLPLPVPGVGSYLLSRGGKRYELKNHLGDIVAVVSDLKLGIETGSPDWIVEYYEGDVVRMQDYYPFGMEMPQRGYVSEEYRYGYNGKEKDNEWNGIGAMLDYGFRVHDPRLGRFLSVDPLAPDYPELTTYQYASNTPVQAIDLDGLEAWNKTRTWNSSDIQGYKKSIDGLVQRYHDENTHFDCADFAVSTILEYAYSQGLEISLVTATGRIISSSDSKYDICDPNAKDQFFNDVFNSVNANALRRNATIIDRNNATKGNLILVDNDEDGVYTHSVIVLVGSQENTEGGDWLVGVQGNQPACPPQQGEYQHDYGDIYEWNVLRGLQPAPRKVTTPLDETNCTDHQSKTVKNPFQEVENDPER